MSWDDLHDSRGPQERPKGGGGGGGPGPGGRGPQFEMPQFKFPKFQPSAMLGVAVLLAVIWLLPGVFYFVAPDEEGVVTQFGKFSRTTQSGLHFKLPAPVERVFTPKVKKVQRTEVGFRIIDPGPPPKIRDVPSEALMLTGDQNIVNIDFVVQYRISDSVAYLFNVRNKDKLVRDVAETVIRGIIGKKKIDEALTTGKAEIQLLILDQMQTLLTRYKSGIQVVTVQLQDVHPPEQVIEAFKDVVSAREDKERLMNEAQGYRNAVIPEARGKAAQIVREAEAYREEKIKKAQGDAQRFIAQYDAYKKAPAVTRRRLYLEMMEEVLPNMQKYIMSDQKAGVLPLLPLGKNALSRIPGAPPQP